MVGSDGRGSTYHGPLLSLPGYWRCLADRNNRCPGPTGLGAGTAIRLHSSGRNSVVPAVSNRSTQIRVDPLIGGQPKPHPHGDVEPIRPEWFHRLPVEHGTTYRASPKLSAPSHLGNSAQRFGPSQSSYDAVLSWLQSKGFNLVQGFERPFDHNGQGGTETQAVEAFNTQIGYYQADGQQRPTRTLNHWLCRKVPRFICPIRQRPLRASRHPLRRGHRPSPSIDPRPKRISPRSSRYCPHSPQLNSPHSSRPSLH